MHLPESTASVPLLRVLESAGSTNDELRDIAAESPEFTVLTTADQRAGRGRLGRQWVAPPGQTLAISVLLKPEFPVERFGWLPLAAGLAMVRAVGAVLPGADARLKWPNDPELGGRKVGGILSELVPGVGVVIGAGVNLSIPADALPTPNATSLLVEGAGLSGDELADAVLSRYLAHLAEEYRALAAAGGDADRAGLRSAVVEACATLGRPVRVELPSGEWLEGEAVGIDRDGRLEVAPRAGSPMRAVAAGDVTHLRYE